MRALLALARLGLHLVAGALTILFVFPRLTAAARAQRVVRWAQDLLAILRVRVVVHGERPSPGQGGTLLVANHVSWLDIHVLHSLLYTRFISKAEVRDWPVIGWLAHRTGTLFLERRSKRDAARVNQEMADRLRAGDCLALFPEGTTSDGQGILPFYPSLFQPAVEAKARVQPVLIRYLDASGRPSLAAAYYGDMSLGESLRNVLRAPGLIAEVRFLPVIEPSGLQRRALAQQAEDALRAALTSAGAGPGKAPETAGHPPGDRR